MATKGNVEERNGAILLRAMIDITAVIPAKAGNQLASLSLRALLT